MPTRFDPPQAAAEPGKAFSQLADILDERAPLAQYPRRTEARLNVPSGSFTRLAPRAEGSEVVIPAPGPETFGQTITLLVTSGLGRVRVRPVTGTINGASDYVLPAGRGALIVLLSDGESRWVDDSGRFGDALRLFAEDDVTLDAGGTIVATARGGNATLQTTAAGTRAIVSGADDVLIEAASDDVFINAAQSVAISTGNPLVERLEIQSDGAWQVGGAAGTTGQVLESKGSAAPPQWTTRGGLVSATADATSTSTTGAVIATTTMAANTNVVGTTYRLEAFITYVKTAVNTTDPRFFVQLAGTSIVNMQIDQNANAGTYYYHLRALFTVRATGAAGVATYSVGGSVVGGYTDANSATTDSVGTQPARVFSATATATLDTTAAQTLRMAVSIAATVAGNSITGNTGVIERVYL